MYFFLTFFIKFNKNYTFNFSNIAWIFAFMFDAKNKVGQDV